MVSFLDNKLKCGSGLITSVADTLVAIRAGNSATVVRKSISFLNPFSYLKLSTAIELAEVIDEFYADGAMLCYCHRLKYAKIERASFDYSSIAAPFFEQVASSGLRVAIVGAAAQEVGTAVARIHQRFPALNIVLVSHGYISSFSELACAFESARPEVVLVGMGTPFQERFLLQLATSYEHSYLAITCGGFLTQTSIREDYYWPLTRKLGLRWLQRMLMHKHVRERVMRDYPIFLIRYFLG